MEPSASTPRPVLVLGVGNLIQMDDGIGVQVLEQLAAMDWPEDVELFDGGTAGLDLLSVILEREAVIVIDAVNGGHDPGTIYRFTPDVIPASFTGFDSIHQLGLVETLEMARLQGGEPRRTVIIGVQPGTIDWGMELTEPVRAAIPRVIEQVRKEVQAAVDAIKQETHTNA